MPSARLSSGDHRFLSHCFDSTRLRIPQPTKAGDGRSNHLAIPSGIILLLREWGNYSAGNIIPLHQRSGCVGACLCVWGWLKAALFVSIASTPSLLCQCQSHFAVLSYRCLVVSVYLCRFHPSVSMLLFYCCCFTPLQQYFSYITAVIWCMRWEGESPSLHFYRLKGSLTSHTI